MAFRERLLLAINALGLNRNSFSERLGYDKNTYIYEYTREKPNPKEPGFDFFNRFVLAKTGIRLDWLLTGEGDMWEEKHTAATNTLEAAVKSLADSVARLTEANFTANQTIAQLLSREVIKQG